MSFTIDQICKLYCVEPIDFQDSAGGYGREGNWLLVSAGCGIMMSVMDQQKNFRYAIDIDGLTNPRARLADWLLAMETKVDLIAVIGGWCVSNPKPLADALRGLKQPAIVYPIVCPDGAFEGLRLARSLSHFFWMLDQEARALAGNPTGLDIFEEEPVMEDSFR